MGAFCNWALPSHKARTLTLVGSEYGTLSLHLHPVPVAKLRTRLQGLLKTRSGETPLRMPRDMSYAFRRIDSGADFTSARDVAAAVISHRSLLLMPWRYYYRWHSTQSRFESRNLSGNTPGISLSILTRPLSCFGAAYLMLNSLTLRCRVSLSSKSSTGSIDRMLTDRRLKRFCDSFLPVATVND